MILYSLRCEQDHQFESWFKDSKAFDLLVQAAQLSCPTCGSFRVQKAIMAPRVNKKRSDTGISQQQPEAASEQQQDRQQQVAELLTNDPRVAEISEALSTLRKQVEANCENVGKGFVEEARKIHYGEVEERGIYGEADLEEAKALVEEGVEIAQLPWVTRKDA